MDAVVVTVIGSASIVIGRRLVLRGWRRGRITTERAALLWAATLPLGLVVWSAVRQQLHPLLLVVLLSGFGVQFLCMRWALRQFDDEIVSALREPLGPHGRAAIRRSMVEKVSAIGLEKPSDPSRWRRASSTQPGGV